jgi:hypothetical protein
MAIVAILQRDLEQTDKLGLFGRTSPREKKLDTPGGFSKSLDGISYLPNRATPTERIPSRRLRKLGTKVHETTTGRQCIWMFTEGAGLHKVQIFDCCCTVRKIYGLSEQRERAHREKSIHPGIYRGVRLLPHPLHYRCVFESACCPMQFLLTWQNLV